VPALVNQKLINKKEVNPIISQLKKRTTRLPEITKRSILNTKAFNNNKSFSTFGSYLKYENVKKVTKSAIVAVKNKKLKETKSIKISNFTSKRFVSLNHFAGTR
jgi:hypothetical protein